MNVLSKNMSSEIITPKDLVILGAGGFAREVAWLVRDINKTQHKTFNLIGFWEHGTDRIGKTINGLPIISRHHVEKYLPNLDTIVAIANPEDKMRAVQEAKNFGCQFSTLIHPNVQYDQLTVKVGPGSIVCAGSILSVNIAIASHVIVNWDCTIGHDSVIEDYVTISPGCHLSGYTTVRRGAYLGTGTVTIEKHEIGAHSITGAGTVVVRDIPPHVTAIGVPAKIKRE
jgi:sugar O-acyltransferase (sialic acid O-acetyltransferase NeuD family)